MMLWIRVGLGLVCSLLTDAKGGFNGVLLGCGAGIGAACFLGEGFSFGLVR